jgi:hypothetical protein
MTDTLKTAAEQAPHNGLPDRSNSLADLAARIHQEHVAVSIALSDSVGHAITAGELLIEAKKQVPHGAWLAWLGEQCTISERTAQLYMRCAKNRETIEDQIRNGVADLSLNEAAAMLALSSDMKKLFDFVRRVDRLSDPEEIMQLCLDSGVAQYAGTIDYESGHTIEQRREWDLYILFMVRHVRWPAGYADDHLCWLKRRDYASPSEWMLDDGWRKRIGMTPMSDQLKQAWTDLLAQTANLDRVEINKLIGEEDRALAAEIAASPRRRRKAQRSLRICEAAS